MFPQQRELTWPVWCLLACLLVLGVTWPHSWRRDARKTPAVAPRSDSLADGPVLAQVNARIGESRWSIPSHQVAEPYADPALAECPLLEPGLRAPWKALAWGFLSPDDEGGWAGEAASPLDVRTLDPPPLLASAPSLGERMPPGQAPSSDRLRRPQQPSGTAEARDRKPIVWIEPSALFAQLEELKRAGRAEAWATAVAAAVRELGVAASGGNVREALARLGTLSAQVDGVLPGLDETSAPQVRAAAGAIRRRLQVWKQMSALGWPDVITIQPPPPRPEQLALAVDHVASLTADAANGQAWSEYLMLDALRKASSFPPGVDDDRRRLAHCVVLRVLRTSLTPNQHRFLRSEPLTSLGSELRRWAVQPIDLGDVLEHLERYEQTNLPGDARRLAADCQALGISMIEGQQALSDVLDAGYRGANFRLTVTEDLLNRLMPKPEPEYAPVSDTILGQRVRGSSLMETRVAVRMIPDPKRARVALEVTGDVSSLTSSTSGPATFVSDSQSTYVAAKPIEVGVWGLHLWPAEVSVENATRLRALRTQFDAIPLVGSMVKSVARSRHDESMPAMRREVETKVARRAKQRVDSEADRRLGEFSKRLQDKILKPLADLNLRPVMLDAQTTNERFTLRLRLAGEDQLGGQSSRPQAPADSLTSFQVHQSALNNFLERLALNGRTLTTGQLRQHLAERLSRPEILQRELRHDDVTITFAPRDAVSLRCDDGRVAVALAIAKLQKPPHTWRNFQVRAFYRPQLDGLRVRLVRDGVVQLIGQRLDTSDQIALRGVFGKVFAKNQVQEITPEDLVNDPRLAGLVVTQCVLRDGWIGVAIGPQHRDDNALAASRNSSRAN